MPLYAQPAQTILGQAWQLLFRTDLIMPKPNLKLKSHRFSDDQERITGGGIAALPSSSLAALRSCVPQVRDRDVPVPA
jgi:hypothetical protein